MARHKNTLTIEDTANMTEEELNAYSAKALKKLAIRTAVGMSISAVAYVGVKILLEKLASSSDEDTTDED